MIEQEKILVERPLKTRAVALVTVSGIKSRYSFKGSDYQISCLKDPVAVAVATGSGIKAFDIEGKELVLEDFYQKFPDTKRLLEKKPRKRRKQL